MSDSLLCQLKVKIKRGREDSLDGPDGFHTAPYALEALVGKSPVLDLDAETLGKALYVILNSTSQLTRPYRMLLSDKNTDMLESSPSETLSWPWIRAFVIVPDPLRQRVSITNHNAVSGKVVAAGRGVVAEWERGPKREDREDSDQEAHEEGVHDVDVGWCFSSKGLFKLSVTCVVEKGCNV